MKDGMQNSMVLTMDQRVQRVAEFMQSEFPADELQGIAESIGMLAPVLWARYGQSVVHPLHLNYPPTTG